MSSRTIFQVLEATAARYGEATALVQPYTEDAERRFRTWTWNQYKQAAEEIAAGLRRLGLGKGDI
ncbi:MAG: long-chain fatty acid--CoA ligase, partial [Bryobacterales bacterium]|nr:long-chain fatty acid--CoA ligase [Bryobacterales bacterium]